MFTGILIHSSSHNSACDIYQQTFEQAHGGGQKCDYVKMPFSRMPMPPYLRLLHQTQGTNYWRSQVNNFFIRNKLKVEY